MKRVLMAVVFATVFSSSALAKQEIERLGEWHIVTETDSFDNSKKISAFLFPKEGAKKKISFTIECKYRLVYANFYSLSGEITSKEIGLRSNKPDSVAFFLEWALFGRQLVNSYPNSETLIRPIEARKGTTEFLVRIERNGLNETFTFDLGTIRKPYELVEKNCKS